MRKTSPIDPLINKTTQGLLAATVLQPDRWWYLSDLAKHLRRRPSSLQQPLAALVSAGILSRRKEGNRVYFQANAGCPFLPELQGLIAKTFGLVDVLRDALQPLKAHLEVAFIHGSVAPSREHSASDIDLIAIGSLGLSDLSPALETAEQRLGRPVNANVYSPQEFAKKLAAKNHFLCSVLDGEKLFVVGKANDLETVGQRKSRRGAQDQSAGA
jgi:DNA-binding transcriptional ArsR family regulator/predicted nucleotidyltransferase